MNASKTKSSAKRGIIIAMVPAIVVMFWLYGGVAYHQGFADGEANVACAPNDGNLPHLLKCYKKVAVYEEIFRAKSEEERKPAKSLEEWNGVSVKSDDRGIFWPYTCNYFPEEYGC